MLLGSVSRKLLMQAPCPVLVVKKPMTGLKRVVLGADGSIESWKQSHGRDGQLNIVVPL